VARPVIDFLTARDQLPARRSSHGRGNIIRRPIAPIAPMIGTR